MKHKDTHSASTCQHKSTVTMLLKHAQNRTSVPRTGCHYRASMLSHSHTGLLASLHPRLTSHVLFLTCVSYLRPSSKQHHSFQTPSCTLRNTRHPMSRLTISHRHSSPQNNASRVLTHSHALLLCYTPCHKRVHGYQHDTHTHTQR